MPENKEKIMFILIKKLLVVTYFLCFMNWSLPTASFQNEDVFVILKTMLAADSSEMLNSNVLEKNISDGKDEPTYSKVKANKPESAWIKSVRVSGKNFDSEYPHDGYSDYSKIFFYVSKSKGFWLAAKSGNGQKMEHRWSIWIDYDKNGEFEDSELQMESTQSEFSRKIRLPETAEKDFTTRMRIFYGSKTGDSFTGEFEDYSLKVIN